MQAQSPFLHTHNQSPHAIHNIRVTKDHKKSEVGLPVKILHGYLFVDSMQVWRQCKPGYQLSVDFIQSVNAVNATRRSVEHCTPHADGAWLNELGWSQ